MAKKKASRSEFDLGGSSERGRERVSAIADQIGRKWGRSTALPLATAPVARIMRLPVGMLMFDWRTCGGLVIGRINRLWGKKSTFKTTTCLRALRSAQNHCRHCKFPLVINPDSGVIDCRCPNPRWWLADEDDYSWLTGPDGIALSYGMLPESAKFKTVKGHGKVPIIKCPPPAHARKSSKAREIVLTETYRNEPMRCVYLDSENTIDEAWATANGVDTSNVLLVGAQWAEQSLATIEESILSREFDFIVIDSTSMMEAKENLEKSITDRRTIGKKAQLMGQFAQRAVSAASEEGLTARYRPTVLCTSQVTTHGIGGPTPAWLGPTDGHRFDHALSLDIKMTEGGYTFDAAKQTAIYGKFNGYVKKNKAGGSPGATFEIKFWVKETAEHPVGDSDDLATVMSYARQMGDGFISSDRGLVLHSAYLNDGKQHFGRVGDCTQFLRDNPTVYDDLRERVLSRLMVSGASLEVPDEAETAITEM